MSCKTSNHLFKVRKDGRKLNEELADAFHHTVYQLLFAANRARRNIQTAVSFLTTRVKAPDKDNWGKLVRVLKYINGTRYMKLILCADEMNFTVHWYMDGSHQIHEDCRGQIGCLMTMGKGAAISSLNIRKCNTWSSTEMELISVHDKLPGVLKYINGTRYMKLILCADEMNFTVHWYMDGSHQIHEDCRGQIGCLMTMGKGAAISSLNIRKCNTWSSTEMELISVHDKLPDIIWTRYFVECQGYDIDEYIDF